MPAYVPLPNLQPQLLHQLLCPSLLDRLVGKRSLVQCEQRDPLRRRCPSRYVVESHRFKEVVLLYYSVEGEGEGGRGGGGLEDGDGGVAGGDEGEVELGVGVERLDQEGLDAFCLCV